METRKQNKNGLLEGVLVLLVVIIFTLTLLASPDPQTGNMSFQSPFGKGIENAIGYSSVP